MALFWWILFAPLLGGIACFLFGRMLPRRASAWLACGAVGVAFLTAVATSAQPPARADNLLFEWLRVGYLSIPFGAWIDALSITMLLTVTGVSFLIHLYSLGYMQEEPEQWRFFGLLNLFVAAMVLLVLADNFALLLVGWGGVGFASCMLIGFYAQRPSALAAARKAFVLNTLGDVGLMAAIFVLAQSGTLNINEVNYGAPPPFMLVALAGLLLAAYAKSAQLPLHTWLPDAMEGPTPVSALIHAATMVTAGVYLVVRCTPLFHREELSWVLGLVAALGLFSAVMAATCALAQSDLKRVLAYSTMSQLGYMFMAVGVGAPMLAIFHLVTHAFFKALLFLSAGSVIHALHGEQNLLRMGGLAREKSLRWAHLGFLVGGLALAGFPPLAGFFSKEGILDAVHQSGIPEMWLAGLGTSALTALYIGRAYFLTFWGGPAEQGEHPVHAPDAWMNGPCLVLLGLTVVAGALAYNSSMESYLSAAVGSYHPPEAPNWPEGVGLAMVTSGLGLGAAYALYARVRTQTPASSLFQALANGWWLDRLQSLLVIAPIRLLASLFAKTVESLASGALPEIVGDLASTAGGELSSVQTGLLRNYAFGILAAVVLALIFIMWAGGPG